MAKAKKEKLSLGELLEQALVKEEDRPYDISSNWVWGYFRNMVTNRDSERVPLSVSQRTKMEKVYDYYGASGIIDKVEKFLFDKKLMLIGEDGANLITRSKPIAFLAEGKYWVNNHAHVIDSNGCILLQYLCFYINSIDLAPYVTGSAQPKMTQNKMNTIPVPLPPLSEQQRIVEVIESLFEKLDTAKEMAQNALDSFENRKAAILHKAFTGELTVKWREENGVSLDEWEEKTFEQCAVLMQNGISKRSGKVGEMTVVLRLANIKDNSIETSDLRSILLDEKEISRYSLDIDDILIIRVNGSVDNVGKLILIDNEEKWAFCDHLIKLKVNQDKVLAQFLIYKSMTDDYKRFIQANMVSSAGQNTISQKSLNKFVLNTPSISEQNEIIRILDNLLENEQRAKELCDVIDKIDLMKKVILARAFRGELGTNDPKEESAVELLKEVLKEKI